MSFHMPSSWYDPPEYSCEYCEDDEDADHQDCIDRAEEVYFDRKIDEAEARREDDDPPNNWED